MGRSTPTRWNAEHTAGSRIDRCYFHPKGELTPVAYRVIPIPGTDHEMILATFDSPSNQRGKGYWKCNVEALRDEKGSLEPMERFIEDEWAQMDPNVSAAERWDSLKKKITQEVKRRAKEKNARKKHTLKETVEKLAKHKKLLRAATKTEDRKKARENIDGLKLKLEDINAYRFMGAKVRSRSKWYAHTERGDGPHSTAGNCAVSHPQGTRFDPGSVRKLLGISPSVRKVWPCEFV
jgi:hypothetical protein